ncbi:uncharacterized membrane protein YsdA (DUF1294 family) [Scopulibacillus darangshiensis]|uniref:Uncharacterized membrane protein YsdA (DUF1294 family) n=1 Tax=Scopulibacillus darangshiensis TaxID=442528 RepID=A0A4R2PAL0_9BACL|nr:DUF1294 domain-containing protein [Scopulibacillus darangshiensis]TCP32113.1 uncharacterized membrane protein YsdA (DUF1294 family) [Scopulibacillus darangshiensis]
MVVSWQLVFIIYMIVINLYGYAIMASDKRKARRHEWRVPEAKLWAVAAIGGAFGSYLGMRTFRHKTKHALFKMGMPLVCLIYVVILAALFTKLN